MLTPRSAFAIAILVLSAMFFSCGKQGSTTAPAPAEPVTKESLEQKVSRLQVQLLRLEARISSQLDGTAWVSTEEKGYAVAQTKYGTFTVLCKNIDPYLDGYKAHLLIGNLTSATFNGAKLSLRWGEDLSKSKETSITSRFFPGRYTNAEVVLTPAKPEDVKTFSVTLTFDQMALY